VLVGIACVVLLSRVNSVLVDLVSQIIQATAVVGRMLILILVLVVIGGIVLIHG